MRTLISCYSKFFMVALAFLFTFSFALVNPGPAAAGELELLVPGQLSVATEGTYPPFSMVDEKGNLYGLEIGVMKEICKRIGLRYKPIIMKWDSLLIALFADQYDVISAGMDITPERQKKVTFSDGWLESGGRLVVRDNSDINDLKDIKGKVVGALVASTMAEAAEGLGAKKVKYFKSETDAIQDLVNG
ncbi:MAG: transporter substrate-binding domain-containing protein, partial [Desulfobacteraceae bacterium]|nr:transporter substrate-binding domain-containing protein [Desulfobacteraceae bacterium]